MNSRLDDVAVKERFGKAKEMALPEELEVMNTSLSFQTDEIGFLSTRPNLGRHQHIAPVALVTKNPSRVKIRSDLLTYRILLGLLDGKYYIHYPAHRLAEYRQTLPIVITVDDILSVCQKKKSKGGYPTRQRQNVITQVCIDTRLRLCISRPPRWKTVAGRRDIA